MFGIGISDFAFDCAADLSLGGEWPSGENVLSRSCTMRPVRLPNRRHVKFKIRVLFLVVSDCDCLN